MPAIPKPPLPTLDWPGKFVAVVFIQGCPWRCGYCHNPHLQLRRAHNPVLWQHVIGLLKRRVGLIDAVVFSGGEATSDPALRTAILNARALGFAIGLHTAGVYPKRLAEVLPLVDWSAWLKLSKMRCDALADFGIASVGRVIGFI